MAVETDVRLRPCRFIELPRPGGVRASPRIPRNELTGAPESRLPDPRHRRTDRVLPSVRRRHRQPNPRRPRRGSTVRRHHARRTDAAVRTCGADDQRGAAIARPRAHVQHGRVREPGRDTAPVSWAGSFQRAMLERFFGLVDPSCAHPRARFTSRPRMPSPTTAAGSMTSAARTSATAGSAGAGTSPSGSPTSARSSGATSTPTSRRAPASSSCTR